MQLSTRSLMLTHRTDSDIMYGTRNYTVFHKNNPFNILLYICPLWTVFKYKKQLSIRATRVSSDEDQGIGISINEHLEYKL